MASAPQPDRVDPQLPALKEASQMRSLRKVAMESLGRRRPLDALLLGAEAIGVQSLRWTLPAESPLRRPDVADAIELPVDRVITPFVISHGEWQAEEVEFIVRHAPRGPAVLFDVGANVGLVTRALCHALPQIEAAVCFEPHPLNSLLLQRNLAHLPWCQVVAAALGPQEGMLPFYVEDANAGNYSLAVDAMRSRSHRQIGVPVLKATEGNLYAPLEASRRDWPVIWKSDTQGFDEVIATTLPAVFWQRVEVGVLEISRISRPDFDRQALASLIQNFAIRRFADRPEHNLGVNEILAFAEGSDNTHADVFLARGAR